MMTIKKYDVGIIGSGPAGLAAAQDLKKQVSQLLSSKNIFGVEHVQTMVAILKNYYWLLWKPKKVLLS